MRKTATTKTKTTIIIIITTPTSAYIRLQKDVFVFQESIDEIKDIPNNGRLSKARCDLNAR